MSAMSASENFWDTPSDTHGQVLEASSRSLKITKPKVLANDPVLLCLKIFSDTPCKKKKKDTNLFSKADVSFYFLTTQNHKSRSQIRQEVVILIILKLSLRAPVITCHSRPQGGNVRDITENYCRVAPTEISHFKKML